LDHKRDIIQTTLPTILYSTYESIIYGGHSTQWGYNQIFFFPTKNNFKSDYLYLMQVDHNASTSETLWNWP